MRNSNRFARIIRNRPITCQTRQGVNDLALTAFGLYIIGIPVCTLAGAVHLVHLRSEKENGDWFDKPFEAIIGGLMGFTIGVCSPIVLPTLGIAHVYNKYRPKTSNN